MEEIVEKRDVPAIPEDIKIQFAAWGSMPCQEIKDISEKGILDILQKIRSGEYASLLLAPEEEDLDKFLMMETSSDRIFLQIWDAETETAWSCFDPVWLDSEEEAPIEPSDGQSVFQTRNTVPNTPENRELTARCAEWYIHTLEPYPGMDWLKMTQ